MNIEERTESMDILRLDTKSHYTLHKHTHTHTTVWLEFYTVWLELLVDCWGQEQGQY